MTFRAIRVLIGSTVVVVSILAASTPASAATKRSVSFKVSASSYYVGSKVLLSGKVSKSPKRTVVRIERYSGSKWRTFKTVKTISAKGNFKTSFTAKDAGRTKYRAVAPKTKKLKAATSKVRTITVTTRPKPAPPIKTDTSMVTKALIGGNSNNASYKPKISGDGRYVVYNTYATNLIADDKSSSADVLIWDRQTRSTIKVSKAFDGGPSFGSSFGGSISDDGRYVAYASHAENIVSGDSNGSDDVFVWDRQTGIATKVSRAFDGGGIDGGAGSPAISADGRYIAYTSAASNIVDDNDTSHAPNVFVWDRQTGVTRRVSQTLDGGAAPGFSRGPTLSADGRYIVYSSFASNIVSDDTNNEVDVFVWDRDTGTTRKVSQSSSGGAANSYSADHAAISRDGRFIAYHSNASNIVSGDANNRMDVFVWDRDTESTIKVSRAADGGGINHDASSPTISDDGRFITYESEASNIDPADVNKYEDIFMWDRDTDITRRISSGLKGSSANGGSITPAISSDGSYVAYSSWATNIVPGGSGRHHDVLLWTRPN